MNIRFILTFTSCFVYFFVASQKITGVVINSKSKEPLSGATVYFNNTTIGTITDAEGAFNIQYNKDLKTELVISFIGFETYMIRDLFFNEDLVVPLKESLNELDEIELSSNDNWSRALKLKEFKKHFLGKSGPGISCKILNEEEIILKYDFTEKKLTAKSKNPLIIENNDLKYLVSVDLTHFEAEYTHVSKNKKRLNIKLVSYYGANQYRSMDDIEIKEVSRIRDQVYRGSTLHFMRALAAERLSKEGFEIFLEKGQHIGNVYRHFKVTPGKGNNGVVVNMPNKMHILYKGEKRSSIECMKDQFYIDNFGNHTPPETVIFTGDFGIQRMGDTLPLDYFVQDPPELN